MADLLRPVVRSVKMEDDAEYQLVTARRSRGGIVARELSLGRNIATKVQFSTHEGDFLISRRQISHGACGLVPAELNGALVSGEYDTLLPTNLLDPAFLRHLTHSIYFQQTCFHSSIGVHVEKLIFRLDDWLRWLFDVPSLAEQRRIAAVLDTWEEAIVAADSLANASASKCNTAIRDLYVSAIKPDETDADWKACTFSDLADVVGGGTPSSANGAFWDGGVAWCTPTDLAAISSRFISTTSRTITDAGLRASAATLLPANSVVLCSRASVGECAINTQPMATNQGFQSLVAHDPTEVEFLYFMVRAIKQRLLTIAAGSTFLEFTRGELRRLKTAAPGHEKRIQIGATLALMDDVSRLEGKRAALLRHQKRGLMQKLLTGEWRVPAAGDAFAPGGPAADRLEAAE